MTDKQKTFERELKLMADPLIVEFTAKVIEMLPDYFFEIPASSTGKYHPKYALGEGGLVRHTIAAVNIAAIMFDNTTICGNFTRRHKDLIISALIVHDGLKSGYPKQPNTVEDHPTLLTAYILSQLSTLDTIKYMDIMTDVFPLIESHMGQWNTTKEGVVHSPVPASGPARYVHMCDYLASRKLIEINFNSI